MRSPLWLWWDTQPHIVWEWSAVAILVSPVSFTGCTHHFRTLRALLILRVPQTCPGPMHHIRPRSSISCPNEDTAGLGSSSPQPCPAQSCFAPSWAHEQVHSPAWLHLSVVLRKVSGSAQVPLVACSWLRWWDRMLRASEPPHWKPLILPSTGSHQPPQMMCSVGFQNLGFSERVIKGNVHLQLPAPK